MGRLLPMGIVMRQSISTIVLRCASIDESRAFYAQLGLQFQQETHDGGPVHYAAECGALLLELYPAGPARP